MTFHAKTGRSRLYWKIELSYETHTTVSADG